MASETVISKPFPTDTVGFLLLIGSADTSARLRVGDQPTRYLVDWITTTLVDFRYIIGGLPENWLPRYW